MSDLSKEAKGAKLLGKCQFVENLFYRGGNRDLSNFPMYQVSDNAYL